MQAGLGIGDSTEKQKRNHIFPRSQFCSTTLNLGLQTSTKPHRDSKNLVGGICAILVLGDFNHKQSGHLILHELKVVLELKQGDVVFFPSAGITHSNSSLRAGEYCYSMVQYTAGQNFNYQVPKQKMGTKKKAELGRARWLESVRYLGTVQDVVDAARLEARRLKSSGAGAAVNLGQSALLPPSSHNKISPSVH